MIIDAHAHLGSCRVFGATQTVDDLLSGMDGAGIETAIVQPFPGSAHPAADHDAIAEAGRRHPGRFRGLASVNPHQDPEAYRREITRCVHDLGFVGVKVHPLGHAVRPGSADARLILDTARELGVPVMIHTGPGLPFADPAAWLPTIREYDDLTILLGHAGHGMLTPGAIAVGTVCPNVVLETSWCNPQDIAAAIATLGPHGVCFGSDMSFNMKVERTKYDAVELDEPAREQVLAGTARRVFGLS
jgi:predicted TIM-barrel fold metal-dependent hydrolase